MAHHPQSNGVVERTNRVVKDSLASLVAKHPRSWPHYLTSVRFAINSALHRSTQDQPLYLLTGKMCLFKRGLTNQQTVDGNLAVQRLAEARQLAVDASRQASARNAAIYNKKLHKPFQPENGMLVLRRNFVRGALENRWRGPSRVLRSIGPVVYEVKDIQPPYAVNKVHVNHLKPYMPPMEMDYAEEEDRDPVLQHHSAGAKNPNEVDEDSSPQWPDMNHPSPGSPSNQEEDASPVDPSFLYDTNLTPQGLIGTLPLGNCVCDCQVLRRSCDWQNKQYQAPNDTIGKDGNNHWDREWEQWSLEDTDSVIGEPFEDDEEYDPYSDFLDPYEEWDEQVTDWFSAESKEKKD